MQACTNARRVLYGLASHYDLSINDVIVEPGGDIMVPAIGAPGGKLRVLDSSNGALNEQTIRAYIELARASQLRRSERGDRDVSPRGRLTPKRFLWEHRVGMIIGALTAFLGLAWVAPLLDTWGMKGAYSAIFAAYRLVCLQTPDRSPSVGGHQCCLCWRCIAIYAGSLLFGVLYTLGRDGRLPHMRWLTQGVGLKGLIIFSLPAFADGLSHTLGLRAGPLYAHSPNFWLGWGEFQADWLLRMATALLATVGAVRFLCPRLDKIAERYTRRTTSDPGAADPAPGTLQASQA
jgi:uncharacterized membrane protein